MKIVNRLPYFTTHTDVVVAGERVRIKQYQIIVWVGIGPPGEVRWDPRAAAFPAILDPGNNHNFSIFAGQLQRWAGIAAGFLPVAGAIREGGRRVPLHGATVWLHRNEPGSRAMAGPPYPLILEEGIAVYSDEPAGSPHLPLLGLRALTNNKLQTLIDGARLRVTIPNLIPLVAAIWLKIRPMAPRPVAHVARQGGAICPKLVTRQTPTPSHPIWMV